MAIEGEAVCETISLQRLFLIHAVIALAQTPLPRTARDMETQGQTPLHKDVHAEAHSWDRSIILSVQQSPADPSIPLTMAVPSTSSPAFSCRLQEREVSPGSLQQGAAIALWVPRLLSCPHRSGSRHKVDFCQRYGPAHTFHIQL